MYTHLLLTVLNFNNLVFSYFDNILALISNYFAQQIKNHKGNKVVSSLPGNCHFISVETCTQVERQEELTVWALDA